MIDVMWSLILGCSLAMLLFYMFNNDTIYRGPDSKNIKSRIYRVSKNGKCYIMQPKMYLCPQKFNK